MRENKLSKKKNQPGVYTTVAIILVEEPPVGNEGVIPGLDGEADILQVRVLG